MHMPRTSMRTLLPYKIIQMDATLQTPQTPVHENLHRYHRRFTAVSSSEIQNAVKLVGSVREAS